MGKKSETIKNSLINLSDTSEPESGANINPDSYHAKNILDDNDLRVLYTDLEKRVERLEKGLKLIAGILQP